MNATLARLRWLADREALEVGALVEVLLDDPALAAPTLEGFLKLSARLPSGLVHAEGLWALPRAPASLAPLAPGSAWYAMERALLVVLPPHEPRLLQLLTDLGRYAHFAAWVAERLGGRDDLVEHLLAPTLTPEAAAAIAHALDCDPVRLQSLDALAPGLREDLGWMARLGFSVTVHLHAEVRPAHLAAGGARLAERLLGRLPAGPFMLAVGDGPALVEHLSPYLRDLAPALAAWARENPGAVAPGVAEALLDAGTPDLDDLALVIPDLFRVAPELLEERRAAEASQGLFLTDEAGGAFGHAELSRLAAPDERALARAREGALLVLAGGPEAFRLAAARHALESGRVVGVLAVLGAALDAGGPVVADGLLEDEDGIELGGAELLLEHAERLGIAAQRAGPLEVETEVGAPVLAARLFGAVRRARLLGRLPADAPALLVLHPTRADTSPPARWVGRAELDAARLGLATLLGAPREGPPADRKSAAFTGASRVTRRLRA